MRIKIKSTKPRRRNLERLTQCIFISWCRNHPVLKNIVHHIPNGGHRNAIEASNFKKMGVLSGVCDVFIPIANSSHHGAYIEFKSQKGKLTYNQSKFIEQVERNGYKVFLCRTAQEAIDSVVAYISG